MATEYDLLIRGGTVVDGSGAEPFEADVAVDGGVIVAVGRHLGRGRAEIDASRLLVTPGFVDIHTHYDGQVTWENRLSPSSEHGVTTVVTGNCGVGFAPCRPADREDLVALMAGVEDIPEVVMVEGLPWTWETFEEYMDTVAARDHDVDVAVMLPHSALRVYAMGRRAIDREPATDDDIVQMAALTRRAMAAGAIGFGTSRALHHRSIDGEPIPTVGADAEELLAIARAMAESGSGVFQVIPTDFDQLADVEQEFALFRRIVFESGRPLSFSLNQRHSDPEGWRQPLEQTEQARVDGLPIRAQVACRAAGVVLGHEVTLSPFSGCPSYEALADLPFDDRIAMLHRPEVRAAILTEAGDDRSARWEQRFEFGDPVNYEPGPEDSLAARAAEAGTTPQKLAYDLSLQDGGRRLIFQPGQNYAYGSLDASYEMLNHEGTVLGLGDGGAHLGLICDASYPTTMLSHWTRDRTRGPKLSVPAAIRALSAETAEAVGLNDRGHVLAGYRADLNVIDYERLQLYMPEVVHDLPAGGRRMLQRANGYVATIVGGMVTHREGEPTGSLPGRLVRGARPAPAAA
ncbi:amidohydrolase family protein [Blastococcus sp. URHD0036]|uniref:N-acyl-D-amino-acid deacylase family protein n=1 Tax=Blastococcus sp. URHD0036 TaxID=1380356 RepID=UPI000496FF2B|nr:amidohydrolase family protein [Blastococcus sp. URHD0036]